MKVLQDSLATVFGRDRKGAMLKFRQFIADWYELLIMTLAILTIAFVTFEILLL